MISVSIHTNKMQEVTESKWSVKLDRMDYRRYMSPYDYNSEPLQTYHKPKEEVIDMAMEKWNEAIRNGLRCSIHVYEIKSFSPYDARLLYEHW